MHEYRIQDAVHLARRDGAPVELEAVGEEGVEPPGDRPLEPVEGEAGRGVANEAVVMDPVHPPSPPAVEEEAVEEVVVAIEEEEVHQKLPRDMGPVDGGIVVVWQRPDKFHLHEGPFQDGGSQSADRGPHGVPPLPSQLLVRRGGILDGNGRVGRLVVSYPP